MRGALRWAVPLAFAAHGLGMIGGVYFVFATRSWLASALGDGALLTAARVFVAILWIVSGIAFVAAGWGFYKDTEWWRTAAWIGAPTTILGVGLWAGEIPPGTYVGAVMAVAVVIALLAGW
ncbi:MAG TPA: hypothetical protein VLA05_05390 [Coriobacteriia bacterium]|nr:hypothetical protein [Coriobacteriia bacterium]